MDLHGSVDPNMTYYEMTTEEKFLHNHQNMHNVHKGNESMHATMVLRLIVPIIVTLIIDIKWKKRHYKSYAIFSTLSMWPVPVIVSAYNQWWRFVVTWSIFTLLTVLVIIKSRIKPMSVTVPRFVYKWFFLILKMSCFIGVVGFIVVMLTFLGFNILLGQEPSTWINVGLMLLFYGVYFGVLGRDVAQYCSYKMAASIGYYTNDGLPTRQLGTNVCAVCGNQLFVDVKEEGVLENTYKLTCGHVFHEFCIHGWCIVGKKPTCPYCKEKVDLRRMFTNPWDHADILYGQLLDSIRWLIAWYPVTLFLARGYKWIFEHQ